MRSVASSVAAFIFSQLSFAWVTLFSASSRKAAGTSIFGISNFGISKRGISNFGVSLGAKPAALAFALVDTVVTSDMVVILSLDDLPDGLMVGFAGDFPGGRVCTSGSAAHPSTG